MDIELKRAAKSVIDRIVHLRDSLDLGDKEIRRDALEREMNGPTFWNDQEKAKAIIQELKSLNAVLKPFEELGRQADDLEASLELSEESGDGEFDDEIRGAYAKALHDFEAFELRSMLGGPNDHCNAFVTIHAGAGGTEACDWAEMLLRMYLMWAESKGFATQITDREEGGAAGIQVATVHIKGEYAYGYLRGESGVHRLVRISPYDAAGRRQTSFASVDVLPEVDEAIDIVLRDDELKRDVFRSGGPGGQHQNKTESGVRYTHLPTGVAAESRSERSQHKNDANALALLKAKLIRMEEEKREADYAKKYDEKGEISFGSQIRSYVLQPYQLVKDLRTDHEVGNPRAVLDGDLDGFIDAYLRWRLSKGGGEAVTS
ncbi:MAG: peptide chain release factor 2 [Planctomycetaceae bacterium]|nr:peptide chain release factor 2 [Planctomycetaceae bacterium]MBV8383727.1 peptide chain release factor 2 [Planctomycetaceae bacterium]